MIEKTRPLEQLVSPQMLEASNGILLAVCVCATIGALLNLFWRWREFDWHIRSVYLECKASVALTWIFGGFSLLTGVKWYLRHAANDGLPPPFWQAYAALILVVGTVAAALGVLCWLRETFPEVLGRWTWFGLLVGCLAFGVGLAL